jgi:hypothetical protein
MRKMLRLLSVTLLTASGCSGSISGDGDYHGAESEEGLSSSGTVGDKIFGSCSTASVAGLSHQIAGEMEAMAPGSLERFAAGGGLVFTSSAVLPYLHPDAVKALKAAAGVRTVELNSAFRTVAQQFLLYRWYQQGRCGIPIAATPGTSNHEGGRAIDVSDWSADLSDLRNHGWSHDVPGDVVHFEHLASPAERGLDVHAFQRLWNRNHPGDRIAEDGDYGPNTAARLTKSPAAGFAIGPN